MLTCEWTMMPFIIIFLMFILSQSSALLTPYNYYSIRRRLTIPKIICCQESFNRVVTHTALRSSSTQPFTSDNDDSKEKDNVHNTKRTALVWLSTNRLRLRDNLALTRAAELGPDGLSICVAWPYSYDISSSTTSIVSPVEAFGYAALHSLNNSLGELGQRILLVPTNVKACGKGEDYGGGGGDNNDTIVSIMAKTIQELNPSHVVVDVSLLDRHHDYTSKLRKKLHNINESKSDSNGSPILIEEVMDDGLLISFDKVHKVLGRSRMGGRSLRWSTFLSNTLTMHREEDDKPTWAIHTLPPPLHDSVLTSIPLVEGFPNWAKQLLLDWGEISEDEALLRANRMSDVTINSSNNTKVSNSSSSQLTEKGSVDTKLSPYLRYGMISPQRAAKAGVRKHDLLWRDWSYLLWIAGTN